MEETILEPVMQYGFAGFCVVLLGFLFWLVKHMLSDAKETQTVVTNNTNATERLVGTLDKHLEQGQRMHEHLLARPCVKE